MISRKLGLAHISTGDIFREYIKKGDSLGTELKSYMNSGQLVPDELTIKIIYDRLQKDDVKNGALLDGYPRTKTQAIKLDEFLKEKNTKIDYVLYLDVEDKIILDRILKRRICGNDSCREIYNLEFKKPNKEGICDKCGSNLVQRPDDTEEVFKERLEVYRQTSPEIIEYYKNTGVLHTEEITVSNHRTSNDVADNFVKMVKK